MPNAVLEAMAVALPVIASDAGGLPEIIEAGTTGLCIERAQLDRLGEGVLELLARPDEARRIGQAARARVVQRSQPAAEVSALRTLLTELLAPKDR